MAVSPPTRGWTPAHARRFNGKAGFPAHAGMDPTLCAPGSPCPWFPRPRGDGPDAVAPSAAMAVVSPPTRGWTHPRHIASICYRGFPAHAGMDLAQPYDLSLSPGFPRPRGDGPQIGAFTRQGTTVSPPTRGWTLDEHREPTGDAGFPAHAGMDPPQCRFDASRNGFPRPRGDGPDILCRCVAIPMVSPPTRGWTRLWELADPSDPGFPAHAGMDPHDLTR